MKLLVMLLAFAGSDVPIEVKSVDDAANLSSDTRRVTVVIRDHEDNTILKAVRKHAPKIEYLELNHIANGVPASIGVLKKFKHLEHLVFIGDANLDDDAFKTLGSLKRLKSLRLKLP